MDLHLKCTNIVQAVGRGTVQLQEERNPKDEKQGVVIAVSFPDPEQVKEFTIGKSYPFTIGKPAK